MTKKALNYKIGDLIIQNTTNQQQFSDKPLTWGFIAGLIQADGSFGFLWKSTDKSFVPRIYISFGQKRFTFAEQKVKRFLQENDIVCQLNPRTLASCMRSGPTKGLNILIEGQNNVNKFVKKIDEYFVSFPPGTNKTYFVQKKLKDFLIFKKAIELNNLKNSTRDQNEKKKYKLISIYLKMKLSERATTNNALDATVWLDRLDLPRTSDYITLGQPEYELLLREADAKSAEFVSLIQTNTNKTFIDSLRSYFTGLMEGDGSFSVGLHTHLTSEGFVQPERRALDFVPSVTLTNKDESDEFLPFPEGKGTNHLFNLVNAYFGTNANEAIVERDVDATRLYWKGQNDVIQISDRLDDFQINKLEFRRRHVEAIASMLVNNQLYSDPSKAKKIVDLRYSDEFSDSQYRPERPKNFYYSIIDEYFN